MRPKEWNGKRGLWYPGQKCFVPEANVSDATPKKMDVQEEGGTVTNRQRVLASLDHRQPDKTPYNIGFTEKARARMAEYYGDADFACQLENCLTTLDVKPHDFWQEVRPNVWQDDFGVQWDRSIDKDIGTPCNQVVTPGNLAEFRFPDPDDARRWAPFPAAVADKSETFVVAALGFSLFERAWTLCGMANLLTAMATSPGFVHALLDRILEFNLRIVDRACSYAIDGMYFGDDWGCQAGLLMGPNLWREYIKPRIRQMYEAVRAQGKFVFIHSCGKVQELFPELIECGLDVFNPFQPEVTDVAGAKARYGGRLSFYGGISTQKTLPYGTVADVEDEVKRLIEIVGKDGGYIAAPAHAIPGDAKPENVAAMIEVLQGQ